MSAPWDNPYSPARSFLWHRGLLIGLAFDLWLGMIDHGGRYGVGGFNVGHFAWLDALGLPVSAGAYVGLLIALGLLSLGMGLGRAPRWGKALLCAGYTYGWAQSLHDSYQHHYLLSWLLLWTVAMQDPPWRQAADPQAAPLRGWGLPMTAITAGIVYTFAAISKLEGPWLRGEVLFSLAHGLLDGVLVWMQAQGLDTQRVGPWLAASTVLAELWIAAGYLVAAGMDRLGRGRRVFAVSAGAVAILFHAAVESSGRLEIGVFSYYMCGLSFVVLAPAGWVQRVARALLWPVRRAAQRLQGAQPGRGHALALTGVACGALAAAGWSLDLPGGAVACALGAGAILALVLRRLAGADNPGATTVSAVLCTASLGLWGALTLSDVRYDYYRRVGGEAMRRGELKVAAAAYEKAVIYAPDARARASRVNKLERIRRAMDANQSAW